MTSSKVSFYTILYDYIPHLIVVSEKAGIAYEEAYQLAKSYLPRAHPTRLSLELNYSVYFYETINEAAKAIELATEVCLF